MKNIISNNHFISFSQIISIFLILIILPLSLSGAIPSQERATLIALYNNTDGDNWHKNSGWKTPPLAADGFAMPGTEKTWYGINCDAGNTTVQKIFLVSNNLNGTITPKLGNLTNLLLLNLTWNQLTGSIPAELGNLTKLENLMLYSNQLGGSIPPELGNLSQLVYLTLFSNSLSGDIPPELGNLTNLTSLELSYNSLSGSIPGTFGQLVKLGRLMLTSNQLSGSIPAELANMVSLWDLGLGSNQLSGSIPAELGNMTKLRNLLLRSNQLSGNIPPELGNLTNLQVLSINSNQLSGSIPPELGNMTKLMIIDLTSNQLGGTIPQELENIPYLIWLELGSNQLSGKIPPGLKNCPSLFSLDLSSNQLNGSIPPGLGDLYLTYLNLSSNQLSGSIPGEFTNANIRNIQSLYLNSNRLSGEIPSGFKNLEYIEKLDIRWNAIYTDDDSLRDHLNFHQVDGDWESTQTIAPVDVTASAVSSTSVDINWTPILYTSDSGGYRVFYSASRGGPYTYFGQTADKTVSSLMITSLAPNSNYYFVVQSRTDPHTDNQNTLDSELSKIVSTSTAHAEFTISGRTTWEQRGLAGVTVTLSDGSSIVTDNDGYYSVVVDYGWSGTITPSKSGYTFSPAYRTYANLVSDQTSQDYTGKRQHLLISGTIILDQKGLAGVTVTLPDGASTVTDDDGKYSVVVDYGWTGTLTPVKEGYFFSPGSRHYNNLTSSKDGQDFKAGQRHTFKRQFKRKIQ